MQCRRGCHRHRAEARPWSSVALSRRRPDRCTPRTAPSTPTRGPRRCDRPSAAGGSFRAGAHLLPPCARIRLPVGVVPPLTRCWLAPSAGVARRVVDDVPPLAHIQLYSFQCHRQFAFFLRATQRGHRRTTGRGRPSAATSDGPLLMRIMASPRCHVCRSRPDMCQRVGSISRTPIPSLQSALSLWVRLSLVAVASSAPHDGMSTDTGIRARIAPEWSGVIAG